MSWVIEGVHEHEGYAAPIAKDGRDVFATRRDGLVMTRPSDAQEEVLPLSELLGWEARCSCGWVGPMWRRRSDAGFWAEDQEAEPGVTMEDQACRAWREHLDQVAGDGDEVRRRNRAALADGRAVLVCPRCCRLLPPCPLPSDYAIVKRSGDGWRCSSCDWVWDLDGQPSKVEVGS